jgi:hypothetical protein
LKKKGRINGEKMEKRGRKLPVLFALGRGWGMAFCFPKTKGYPPYPGGIQFESLAAVSSGVFGVGKI